MTKAEQAARAMLKRTGVATYRGYELWSTHDAQGRYTGRFRMAPAGQREHHRDYEQYTGSLVAAFTFLHQQAEGTHETQAGADA